MADVTVSREAVLCFRLRQHQLDREPGTTTAGDLALLDYGVQDTGADGAPWAMEIRGMAAPAASEELAYAWTIRGAPHAYRRSDLTAVAVATAPLSEADAAKKIFDAAKPLKEAGIPALDALRTVAEAERAVVTRPTVKGDVSGQVSATLGGPYVRPCRPCKTIHIFEMTFRLAALQGGLELEPGTSPPVMRRIPGFRPQPFRRLAGEAEPRFDAVRNYLRFYGPARPRDAAEFADALLKDVKAHWPEDVVEVSVDGERRHVLAEDLDGLTATAQGNGAGTIVRLVGPYDPYLQLRDRELLVADEERRKDLWRVLGRPGAIVADGEIAGTWRPRAAGKKLTVLIQPWRKLVRQDLERIEEQAERLAAHRDVTLAGVTED